MRGKFALRTSLLQLMLLHSAPFATDGYSSTPSRRPPPRHRSQSQQPRRRERQPQHQHQNQHQHQQPSPEPLRYYASCARGLEATLVGELSGPRSRVRARRVRAGSRGVEFDGDAAVGYRAVLWLRTANKVLELLADERRGVDSAEALYSMARGSVEWEHFVDASGTVSVDAVLGNTGPGLTHSHFCALTVKNALVDQFRDGGGGSGGGGDGYGDGGNNAVRPSVDTHAADLPLVVYLHRGAATLYRSLGGAGSLHKRGYRGESAMHAASLRETLAAAMLEISGWPARCDEAFDEWSRNDDDDDDDERPRLTLIDPMCGSGTVAIEAALMARNIAPGLLRLGLHDHHDQRHGDGCFAVQRFPDLDHDAWAAAVREAREEVRPNGFSSDDDAGPFFRVLANDWHPAAIALARKDAAAAGVAGDVNFSQADAAEWCTGVAASLHSGDDHGSGAARTGDSASLDRRSVVVSNPPWDLRIGGAEEAWAALGAFMRRESGHVSDAFLLCGNADATRHLRMKASQRTPIASGGVDLRVLHYKVLPPRKRNHDDDRGQAQQGRHHRQEQEQQKVEEEEEQEQERQHAGGGNVDGSSARDYSSLSVKELKGELRARGLRVSGLKRELIERLQG